MTEVAENGISDDLQEKYSKIASEDLLMEVENLRPDSLSHEIFYLGGESAEQSLANQDLNDAVLIVVGNRYERHNKFDQSGLNNNVKSGRLPNNKPPEHFYPFSPDDDRYYIAKFLSQELVHFASRNPRDGIEFDVDELLENSCKSWDYIRDKEKEKLRRKANGVLKMFDEMNLDENIKKLDDRRYFVRSSQALQEKCQKVVSKLENDATLDDYNGISSTK
ncbi:MULTISPECIES: hypothetical protein [unclassified Haloferax]|uniref:hypothetical protein n=1 Tax=unclassified Haloferax TaxID=2625095 RepID=UPI0012676387|nr:MULTISPECIES: hypothetical protein [unclassified Haloferax]